MHARSPDGTLTAKLSRGGRLVLCDGDSGAVLLKKELGGKMGRATKQVEFSQTSYHVLLIPSRPPIYLFNLGTRMLEKPIEDKIGSAIKDTAVVRMLRGFKAKVRDLQKNPSDAKIRQNCNDVLDKMKIEMLSFGIETHGVLESKKSREELAIKREILEMGSFLHILQLDIPAFERHVSQLKVIYRDYSSVIVPSERKDLITGLHLMSMLAHNKLSEFHTEIELIADQTLLNPYIKYPINIEQRMMEGSYSKVRGARRSMPSTYYGPFLKILEETIRDRVAASCSVAYDSITVKEAKEILGLKNLKKTADKHGWRISGSRVEWPSALASAKREESLESKRFVQESLGIAEDLERIV